ncbi:MAG: beta-lactamase family protein [Planctomycetes bacterium]|nr:beta-lactamase family protein [Planctomycetota bacterium]
MRTPSLALLLFGLNLPAQEAAPAAAPTLEQQVDRIFRGCQRDGHPGAVVLIAHGDTVLLQKGYGLADLERGVPLTPDSVLDIGSTSKQFTAASMLLLADDGALSLDDRVRAHVGELPKCFDAVTLRHLMLHTSGIPDYIHRLIEAGRRVEDVTTMDDALEALAAVVEPDFAAGTRWAYSNSNYVLISEVVERVSGLSLPQFARERIFEPLGMTRTHIHERCTDLVPDRALSYSRSPRGGWRWHFSNWEQTGDGAVFTTVGDLLKWSRNFHHGKVGGGALLERMAKPGALDDGAALRYGAGLMFGDLDGVRVVRHSGAWAAYRAELLRVPSKELTVVCLCNRDDLGASKLVNRMARIALASPSVR